MKDKVEWNSWNLIYQAILNTYEKGRKHECIRRIHEGHRKTDA